MNVGRCDAILSVFHAPKPVWIWLLEEGGRITITWNGTRLRLALVE